MDLERHKTTESRTKLGVEKGCINQLVGTDEDLQRQLAQTILKEKKDFKISIFKNIEASLAHVDANFFLGKVCFLVTGVGRVNHCSVDMSAVRKLGDVYCSPLIFCELELEGIRISTAQRLLRMLQICAGHVPGVSALFFSSLMRSSNDE
ncbi:centromere protein M isoform X3 [Alligator mississippiensis]|uniref:centromere protein M isoform X3 n=1 Tax=Alligator mississippiensis TaxID=8496 RepID=UPI0028778BE8|nr:centromere protein M isoform X3 [Alligator mississippiensis]